MGIEKTFGKTTIPVNSGLNEEIGGLLYLVARNQGHSKKDAVLEAKKNFWNKSVEHSGVWTIKMVQQIRKETHGKGN